jgi:preprotein translocase subunit YajC
MISEVKMYQEIKSGDSVTFTSFGGTPVTITSFGGASVWVTPFGGKSVTLTSFGGQPIVITNPSSLPENIKEAAGLSRGSTRDVLGKEHFGINKDIIRPPEKKTSNPIGTCLGFVILFAIVWFLILGKSLQELIELLQGLF